MAGMTLTSANFGDGDYLGTDHILSETYGFGCAGGNVSPRLSWSGVRYRPQFCTSGLPLLAEEIERRSLMTLLEKLVKTGAKVVRHGRYVTFQLDEVPVSSDLFRKFLSLIYDPRSRPAPAQA